MKKTLALRFKKANGKIVPENALMAHRLKEYIKGLNDNDVVEAIFEADEPDNTKAQLAKIHVMIKEIADETGEDFKKMKSDVKEQCGLTKYIDHKKYYKSFAQCSKKELSDVIEKLYAIGEFLNINFRKDL